MTDEEIKLRFDYMSRDLSKVESAVNLLTATMQGLKPNRNWPSVLTMLMVVLPLYALVVDIIVKGKL